MISHIFYEPFRFAKNLMRTLRSPLFARSLILSLAYLSCPYNVTAVVSSTIANSTLSPPRTVFIFASLAHIHPNKMVKLNALFTLSMTLCVLSYFRLAYHLVFGPKHFTPPLTSSTIFPQKQSAPLLHILPFTTPIPITRHYVSSAAYAIPTPPLLCLINCRRVQVLAFFLAIPLIIRDIGAWTSLPTTSSSLVTSHSIR